MPQNRRAHKIFKRLYTPPFTFTLERLTRASRTATYFKVSWYLLNDTSELPEALHEGGAYGEALADQAIAALGEEVGAVRAGEEHR